MVTHEDRRPLDIGNSHTPLVAHSICLSMPTLATVGGAHVSMVYRAIDVLTTIVVG